MRIRWAILLLVLAAPLLAAPTGKKFSSPEKAVEAFVAAVRSSNQPQLVSIFGKESEGMFRTDDPVNDEALRTGFLTLYDAKHAIIDNANGTKSLVVGNDDWPFPIPLVKAGSKWAFDTAAGAEEINDRRIGRNELAAIQTCLAVGDAQREYYSRDHDGDGILEFSQSFRSTVGLRNGLFWPVSDGEPQSPLGQLIVTATGEGYTAASTSYHGYRYRLLQAQGPSAAGGAYSYMAGSNQIGGFAVLAYPASYGDSGIMTLMVNHDGVVYQKDLGEATEAEALKIQAFDPGQGWTKVPDQDLKIIVTPAG